MFINCLFISDNPNFSNAKDLISTHKAINNPKTTSISNNSHLFSRKTPVKLHFIDSTNTETTDLSKRRKTSSDNNLTIDHNKQNQNHNDLNSTLSKNNLKFDNCTYNSCNFYITTCDCKNKEN